jgi:hypothetical protein
MVLEEDEHDDERHKIYSRLAQPFLITAYWGGLVTQGIVISHLQAPRYQ